MQENWIGRSEGVYIKFQIKNHKSSIQVFTTRPDTLFGCTYLILSPEHPDLEKIVINFQKEIVDKYCKESGIKNEIQRLDSQKAKQVFYRVAH